VPPPRAVAASAKNSKRDRRPERFARAERDPVATYRQISEALTAGGSSMDVAQIFNLLYRRFVIGRRSNAWKRRLKIRDTAD